MIGIYKITNPKGKVYIGQSVNINKRFKTYRSLNKNVQAQVKLYRSFKKYGLDKHVFEIVVECDIDRLNELERYYQDIYQVLTSGLNLNLVNTDTKKKIISKEVRIKISNSTKGIRKGIKLTEEHKQKLRGKRNLSEEVLNGFRERSRNKIYSKETKLKMRESNKSKKLVLNINTGIFYDCITEAEEAYCLKKNSLYRKLNGTRLNKTQFIYV